MPKLSTNLLLDGVIVGYTREAADGETPADLFENFKAEIYSAIEAGYTKVTTNALPPASTPASAASAPTSNAGLQSLKIVYFEVEPKAGGKATVKLFSDDRKSPRNDFPSLSVNNWKAEDIVKLFAQVKDLDETFFATAGKYTPDQPFTANWKYGKTNSSGTQYKDVVSLHGSTNVQVEEPAAEDYELEDIPF